MSSKPSSSIESSDTTIMCLCFASTDEDIIDRQEIRSTLILVQEEVLNFIMKSN